MLINCGFTIISQKLWSSFLLRIAFYNRVCILAFREWSAYTSEGYEWLLSYSQWEPSAALCSFFVPNWRGSRRKDQLCSARCCSSDRDWTAQDARKKTLCSGWFWSLYLPSFLPLRVSSPKSGLSQLPLWRYRSRDCASSKSTSARSTDTSFPLVFRKWGRAHRCWALSGFTLLVSVEYLCVY